MRTMHLTKHSSEAGLSERARTLAMQSSRLEHVSFPLSCEMRRCIYYPPVPASVLISMYYERIFNQYQFNAYIH